jgi:hypothetical protein
MACCLLLVSQSAVVPQSAVQQGTINGQQQSVSPLDGQHILEDGTPVKVRLSQTVSSADAHVNDRVEFEVLEEVKISDVVVIPKGGIAWGTVTEAMPKRRMARGGKLEIAMDAARLVDGERVALTATAGGKGGGHTGAMTAGIVATALVAWPAAPFFLFMHGKDITLPKGTVFPVFTNGNLPLDLAKFQPPPSPAQEVQAPTPQVAASAADASQSQAKPTAQIEITSTPSGGEIQLDGNFVGNTPSTIGISAGDHVITIKKSGYKLWERKLTISTGKVVIAAELAAD